MKKSKPQKGRPRQEAGQMGPTQNGNGDPGCLSDSDTIPVFGADEIPPADVAADGSASEGLVHQRCIYGMARKSIAIPVRVASLPSRSLDQTGPDSSV